MEEGATAGKNQGKDFDQFYTQDAVAEKCLAKLLGVMAEIDAREAEFLEPAAGDGAFLRALEKAGRQKFYACDIDPHHEKIAKKDFLEDDLAEFLPKKEKLVVIGNPPFGKRARMAAAFLNKAFDYSDTVAFILPLQFQKYSAQNKLIPEARLIFDEKLADKSFVFNGKDYAVRCCFQIWTKLPHGTDLRLRTAPATTHADFEMWQYNNTREAEKYFDKTVYQWDFAIPRQGYKDYTLKESDPEKLDRRTQWIFFKAKTPEVLAKLKRIDYTKLSRKNTSIPGFGKADVVAEYREMFGD